MSEFEPDTTDATAAETAGSGTELETQPDAPAERTFRQDEVNRIVEDRLWRDRQARTQPERPAPVESSDGLTPIAQRVALMDLQYRADKMRANFPDFAENETAIWETAVQLAEHASPQWLAKNDILEVARRYHLYPKASQIDVKKIEAAAKAKGVEEYLAQKKTQASGTPRPEGSGGGAPTGGKGPDPKDAKANRDWALDMVRQARKA